jgi:hypothetical protein
MAGFAKKPSGLSSCESDIRRLIARWINEDVCLLRRIAEQTAGRASRRKCLTVLRAVQLISVF